MDSIAADPHFKCGWQSLLPWGE